jgi:hypothetical protein
MNRDLRVEIGPVQKDSFDKPVKAGQVVRDTLHKIAESLAGQATSVMRGAPAMVKAVALLTAANSPADMVLEVTLRRATADDLAQMDHLEARP